jgi:sRNA-binding regulator protein Hfq
MKGRGSGRGGRSGPGGGRGRERSGGGRGNGGRSGAGRRTPPPESTGAEANYLNKNKEARTPMVVSLVDGETVHGVIEYYDRDMIKINRDSGPNLFIRKANIRYMYKDPDASRDDSEE